MLDLKFKTALSKAGYGLCTAALRGCCAINDRLIRKNVSRGITSQNEPRGNNNTVHTDRDRNNERLLSTTTHGSLRSCHAHGSVCAGSTSTGCASAANG
ncbi:hypothetical protein EVAR_49300_1 [Eumeta japonica]|uniref:Uncharacterized protein n=1 Tax=Eumeta variegata TaxID=151549 RepID=A0A4C1XL36_EUMVA|nr:hypothetical protein EVAR_49300_1 [Eumeta japonica]